MKYFVETKTIEAVSRVGALLSELAVMESWLCEQADTGGKLHDVCEIPDLKTMKLIRSMELQDSRVRIVYWKREETGGARLESADFLLKRTVIRRTAKFRSAVARLKAIEGAKADKAT